MIPRIAASLKPISTSPTPKVRRSAGRRSGDFPEPSGEGTATSITYEIAADRLSRTDNAGYVGWVRTASPSQPGETAGRRRVADPPGRASRGPTAVLG